MKRKQKIRRNNKMGRGLENALDYIKKLIAVPTADEVCEALQKWLEDTDMVDSPVTHDDKGFFYYLDENLQAYIVEKTEEGNLSFAIVDLPPYLVNIISRFYMSYLYE